METVGGRSGRRVGRVFGRMKEWMLEFSKQAGSEQQ
jgi:hypothetical protein